MYYDKTKKGKIDKCNICLQTKNMTWDHVPPQGCSNFQKVEIASFFDKIVGKDSENSYLISQNGLKYRTICGDCNSLLGGKYDDELNVFVKSIIRFVNSSLLLPPITRLKVKPLPIIKSVVGHILAAKKQLDEIKYDNIFREFVLDESAPIPNSWNLFYWIYPYENTIVMRDFGMPAKREGDFNSIVFFQLLKFFPVAFMLAELDRYQGLPSLSLNRGISMETELDLPIYLNIIHDRFWPETVDNNNIIFASRETGNSVIVKNNNARR